MNIRSLIQNKSAVLVHFYALAAFLLPVFPFIWAGSVSAADLNSRSITLSTPQSSVSADHTFSFTISTTANVGSIAFQYCESSPLITDPCTPTSGLDVSSATLSVVDGDTFTKDVINTTPNRYVLTRVPAPIVDSTVTYRLNGAINPSGVNATSYVRIFTYPTNDATGPHTDTGSVAFSTNSGISTTAYVPPYLTFCVGVSVAPDCSNSTGNRIDLGLLATSTTSVGSSQFAGATNDSAGYSTTLLGLTMTSGNNIIPAATTPTASILGVSQFGINLRQNTAPVSGQNKSGIGTSVPVNGYGVVNAYKFVSGDVITNSSLSTDFNVFTTTYVVNIGPGQPPGVYATTVTYTATAAF